jgi:hypothetical protein
MILDFIFIYFQQISLRILNSSYKKFKKLKIPYSFLPGLYNLNLLLQKYFFISERNLFFLRR